jgi:hypothetical protein
MATLLAAGLMMTVKFVSGSPITSRFVVGAREG